LKIERQKLYSSNKETIIDSGVNHVESLAVDYMADNIYWTDESMSVIKVAKLENTSITKTVIYGNLSHPRAIALDHKHR
jgi:hypothetical protein